MFLKINHLHSASDCNFYDAHEPKSRQEVHGVCFEMIAQLLHLYLKVSLIIFRH